MLGLLTCVICSNAAISACETDDVQDMGDFDGEGIARTITFQGTVQAGPRQVPLDGEMQEGGSAGRGERGALPGSKLFEWFG